MDHSQDKRRTDRFSCSSPVEWVYFNKTESHRAWMRNFSGEGVCLECSRAPLNGATILMRLDGYDDCRSGCRPDMECPWPRSLVLGDVKWCRDISGSGEPRFGVGVKFHLPV